MPYNNLISEKIVLPISDLFTGYKINRYLKFLFQSQYWTKDQLENYQNLKLKSLIHHAYENVPFYRQIFHDLNLKPSDIQSKEDLKKLPIITKEDLKRNKKAHFAINLNKRKSILTSSSGSTGEPFQFYITKQSESFFKAASIRAWYWMGYKLGDKYVKVSMNPRSSHLKKIQDKFNNCLYLSSNQLEYNEFTRILKNIKGFKPKFIRCYPAPLYFLSQILKLNPSTLPSLIAINTTGSTLHKNDRKEIENVFNTKIFDSYSCEGGTIFAQCPTQEFYHPAEEYAISEFIADEYTRSQPDNPVRHITTDLYNYASPFIRYDTQDYVVLGENKKCSCGSNFINIKEIKGRDSDILITPKGKFLLVENFVAYFEWFDSVDQIQIVQNKIDEITFNLVVNNGFTDTIKKEILAYWQKYIGNDVIIKIEICSQIQLTPSGKRRTVIRNLDINLFNSIQNG